jgi:hypothetical protein
MTPEHVSGATVTIEQLLPWLPWLRPRADAGDLAPLPARAPISDELAASRRAA